MSWYEPVLDLNLLPDAVLRVGIRKLLRDRLAQEDHVRRAGRPAAAVLGRALRTAERSGRGWGAADAQGSVEANVAAKLAYVARLKELPIAINTPEANEQHYEVPTEYYQWCLGKRLKYSSCYYPDGARPIARGAGAVRPWQSP